MVAVGVPVPVGEILSRSAVDDKVAGGILVKSADDVEHGRLAAAGMTQYRDKLALAKFETYSLERMYDRIAGHIVFSDFF